MPDSERKLRYIGDARVLEVRRKAHLDQDEILVKLRKDGEKPWWQRFKFAAFEKLVEHRPVPT